MKQKLFFFFLTAFQSLIGGGELWAEQVTFNTTSGNLTTPQDEISLTYGSNVSLQNDNLKVPKGNSFTIATSSRYIQSIEITLRNNSNDTYAAQYVSANVGSTEYDDANKIFSWTGLAKTIVFTNANVNGARDFRPVSIVVTYTTTDPSTVNDATIQTYPYTWDFNSSASLWASSIDQMGIFTDEWNHITEDSKDEYRPKNERSNWGYNIDLIKGLRFDATNTSNPCLDYKNGIVYVNNTVITIPGVKAGQIIRVTGGNVSITSHTNTTEQTATTELYEYKADSDDDVALTFGESWIKTIAVLKTDIATIGVGGGSVTSKEVGSSAWSPLIVFRDGNTNILTMSSEEWSSCTVTNSDDAVITVSKGGYNTSTGGDGRGSITVTPVAAGTSTVTISFPGSDRYNAKEGTITFTITKQAQTLSFAAPTKTVYYDDPTPENTLTQTPATGGGAVTYSSSDTHVASVNESTGALTIHNAGTCTITATAAETETYGKTTASYELTVNPTETAPTITMTQNPGTTIANGATVTTTFGNTVTVTGECSVSGPTVKYRSSKTSVATVDANGVVTTKGGGTTTITVYTDSYQGYPAASVSYTLTVNPTSFTLAFTPTSGKVNVGATITPQMTLPTLMLSDLLTVTASSDDPSVATVPSDLMEKEGGNYKYLVVNEGRVNRFLPIITGVAVGTAHITVNFTSNNYNSTAATYTVEVTADGTRNFSWADGTTPTYTIYTGDFLMMPEISGNSNGNDSYSDGSKNKYVYHIKNGVTELNNKDYRRYEGVPDFMLVDGGTETTDGTHASVFWAQGSGGTYPDVLMVYGKSAGTVTLRAKDPQNSALYCDATINIVDKSELASAVNTYVGSMSFPYTWDFTTDFDMSDITANSHYWVEKDDHYYAGNAYFNLDYADEDNDGNTSERFFKYMDAGTTGAQMPLFYGMQVNIQGSSYYNTKIDRLAIKKYTSAGQPRLVVNGGTMQFKLPNAPNQPSSYRIYMKVKTQSSTKIAVGSKQYGVSEYTEGCQLPANSDAIVYFDVNSTASASEGTTLNFDNVNIYWIATSTEEKQVKPHPTSGMRAATYSYGEDLNFTYSGEANPGLKAYVASSFSSNSVNLTEAPKKVKSGTGLVLKSTSNEGSYSSCYMIACGKNLESYSSLAALTESQNYLKPSVEGETIHRFEGTEGEADRYTNFLLSKTYVAYDENTEQNTTESAPTTGWLFLRVNGESAVAPANMSYLHVPGTLRVINTISAARRAGEEDDKPASKNMLFINFIDDPDDLGTTDISAVSNDGVAIDNDAWYTLQGVRVSAPTKGGIYIHNGRKVVIK